MSWDGKGQSTVSNMREPVVIPERDTSCGPSGGSGSRLSVFLMDFLCIVPYYTAQLCKALSVSGARVALGSPTYDLDTTLFERNAIYNKPGLFDRAGRRRIKNAAIRRALKVIEATINMAFVACRFIWSRPDVVHIEHIALVEAGLPFELWFIRFARWLGSTTVLTVHNLLPHDTGDRYKGVFERVYHLADALICHTADARDQLVSRFGVPYEKTFVIPHGPLFHDEARPSSAEAKAALGVGDSTCVVLYQGFIKPYKGISFLLDAWRIVHELGVNARLVIAGCGEQEQLADVVETIDRLGISDSVTTELKYLSPREIVSLYEAADVVVYPYKKITTSGAAMTGIAMRKAIVATALPYFEGILAHRHNAVLVDYGDTVRLAKELAELAADADLRDRLAANLPSLDEGVCSWPAIGRQTIACYAAAIARAGARLSSVPDREIGRR